MIQRLAQRRRPWSARIAGGFLSAWLLVAVAPCVWANSPACPEMESCPMASSAASRTSSGMQDCDPLMGMDCQSASHTPLHVVPADLIQALPQAVLLYTLSATPPSKTNSTPIVFQHPARDLTARALRTTRLLI